VKNASFQAVMSRAAYEKNREVDSRDRVLHTEKNDL